MKTSILVSSTAAVCLLLTFAEAPKHRDNESSITNLFSSFTYIPANLYFVEPSDELSNGNNEYADVKTNVKLVEDFNYLKFDVASYSDKKDESGIEVTTGNTLDYLKFDVSEYSGSNEMISPDATELPVNDFAYLKFTVTENTEIISIDALELPVNDFATLKFDVTEYTENTKLSSFDALELPVNDFEYLKFDVTKLANNDEIPSEEITELPVDEFSYLKFNINNSHSTLNSDNIGEMPIN